MLHGLPNVFTTVSIETLVGGGNWFTQSVRSRNFSPLAFGQVEYTSSRARLNWLLPCAMEASDALADLVENLAFETGLRGSLFLLAGAQLDSQEFILLRRQGFCTYGWEKYWRVDPERLPTALPNGTHWRRTRPGDQHDILKFQRHFYAPAMRAVLPLADEVMPDYTLYIDGLLQGIASIRYSSNRAVMRLLLDPRISNPEEPIEELLAIEAAGHSDWFIQELSGQDWLEDHLQSLALPASARRELLVKYFAVREKLPFGILNHSSENGHPDPVAPYAHIRKY